MALFDQVEREILRALRPVLGALANLARRAVVRAVDTDSKQGIAQVEVTANETADGAEIFQHYGFASAPPVGCEAIVVRLGATAEGQVILATAYRQKRPAMGPNEAAIWDLDGQIVALRSDRIQILPKAVAGVPVNIVEIGGPDLTLVDGVVTGLAIDPFTGQTQAVLQNASRYVRALK